MATNASHTVKHTYGFNKANQVKKFKAIATWNASLKGYDIRLVDEGYFAANKLYVTSTKDEDGNYSDRFTDQEDKVLASVQLLDFELAVVDPTWPGGSLSGGITGGISNELAGKSVSEIINNAEDIGNNLTDQVSNGVNAFTPPVIPKDPSIWNPYFGQPLYTYYVYDQYNNLTYVLPPLAYGKTDATTLDQLCYQYKYDHKNRLVAKKLPGKEWEFMVYDKADRLLAQGPVYSPFGDEAKGWMFSKYDAFGRVVYTGFYTGTPSTAAGRATFQGQVDTTVDFHEKRATASTIDQVSVPYTNVTLPKTAVKILGVNYYDDYSFAGAPALVETIEEQEVITQVKGLPTGAWTRVITTANEAQGTLSYTLYDYKERVLRSYKTNSLGGYTQVDTKYNFRGLPTKTMTSHKYKNGVDPTTIEQRLYYDKAERLLYQTHKIGAANPVVLFENRYDELGRVKQKRVGGRERPQVIIQPREAVQKADPIFLDNPMRTSFLQELNYTYNIRGWLTQVNSTSNLEAGDFGKKALFAMKLNYNTLDSEGIGGVKKLYNGTIAEQTWKTAQDNVLRRYSYAYDRVNRLKAGTYQEPGGITPVIGLYDEKMSYDANGNITSLNRKGRSVNTAIALDLDQLTYSYEGNILQKVVDSSNNTDGFKQGSTADKHYDYDSFGNLKVDRNKGITAMKYNHLNLPTEVVFAAGKITYLYTATGEKIQKKVTQGSTTVVTDYVDGFQYVNGVLSFFPTAEGYFNAETQNYVYQYRDHLGNVRLSYSDANKIDKIDVGEIIEETNYYPFGLAHQGYNEKNNTIAQNYKYQYNGKEKQDELGLNVYDYGARNYDAALGRWMNVDPLAEQTQSWTPYHYVHNNPMNLIDPTGMSAEGTGGGWFSRAWSAVKNTFSSSAKTEDMTVLDEIVISVKGQTKEERVRDKQIDIVSSRLKEQQLIQEWTNLGVWDPNISYDNYAHAVGSQIGLAMPSARFNGLFNIFSKSKDAKIEFNASSFADEIVRINKTTDGGGVLLNGTPSSAVNSAMYYDTTAEQGASIFRSISGGHMFMNGNKRTAVATFNLFAKQNGLRTVSQRQIRNVATKVATGKVSDVSQIAKKLTK
ncbi:RHS repeat-associated core domain-containing protein [Myroides sp. mNGS23_01]|nr:RHS repeat-associated core domain-containing protein [Myroides sp. mNGS23_01]WHT39831.1 RHS repeat-associated core domain-containing protein [Myroides sp. mNGS23_01]